MVLPDVEDFVVALLHYYEVVDEIAEDHQNGSADGSYSEEKVLWVVLGTLTNPCVRQRFLVSEIDCNNVNDNDGEKNYN